MKRTVSSPSAVLDRIDSRRRFWAAVLAAQALTLAAYLTTAHAEVRAARYLLYPFVWIDAGAWAVMRVSLPDARLPYRALALAAGLAYFAAMLWVAGFLGGGHAEMTGVRVVSAPPGWGPMVALQTGWVRLYVVPFQWLGYAALAYLFYGALLDAARTAASGLLGLVSCVGCTWTLVEPLVAGTVGGVSTAGIGSVLYAWTYDLTTALFVATVGLLVWTLGGPGGR